MCTGRGSNQGTLGPKSDALTTAPPMALVVCFFFEFSREKKFVVVVAIFDLVHDW